MRASAECQHGPGPGTFVLSASVFLYSDRAITCLPHSQVPGLDTGSCVKHVSTKLHWRFDFVIQDISYCQCDFVMWEISC